MLEIVPYRSQWPIEFQEIGQKLRDALGILAIRIDHIGSTAVPGLSAKDRIDIQVTVESFEPAVEKAIIKIGYTRKDYNFDHLPPGSADSPQDWVKWFFASPKDQRPTNLHVRLDGHPNQRYALLFRDYLRAHPRSAKAYGDLKRRLAAHLANPSDYPNVKDPAVDLIYFAALDWAETIGWKPAPSDC